MKKLTSLVALFLMCLGMTTNAQTIESVGENITDPKTQLTEDSYVVFKNVSTGKYIFVDPESPFGVKMGADATVGAGTQYLWQVHKTNEQFFFTSCDNRFFPRPKTKTETKNGLNCAGTNGAYKGVFTIAQHTTTAYWTMECKWTENKTKKHDKFWSVDGDTFVGIDVASKDAASTQYEIIPVTVNKTPEQLAVEAVVNPWKEVIGYAGAYDKKTVDAAAKCGTAAEAKAKLEKGVKKAIDDTEFFRIVNVNAKEALNVVDGQLSTVNLETATDFSNLWRLTKGAAEGVYTLKNANYAKYLQALGTNTLGETGVELTFQDKGVAQWTLTAGGNALAKTAEGIVAAAETAEGAQWYLAPVQQIKVQLYPTAEEAPGADVVRWATIYMPCNAFCLNTDVKCYAVSEVSATTATLTPATGVHLNTGIILQTTGEKDFFQFKIGQHAEGKTEVPAVNLLKGTNIAVAKTANSLVLGNGAQGVGLYAPSAANLKANKAYLDATVGTNALKFVFGEATGVENVEVAAPVDNIYYDLSGRRVANPVKGIYILNGKKVYVK